MATPRKPSGAPKSGTQKSELARVKARIQAILDTTVDGIITINDRGVVDSYNRACGAMFGYAAEEVIGQNVSMLMTGVNRERHDQYLAHYIETGERQIIGIGREVEGRRKDGSTFPLELSVSEVLLDGARLFTGILRDIGARHEAERRLHDYAHHLEIKNLELEQAREQAERAEMEAEESTTDMLIAKEEAEIARAEAEIANQAKSSFLANMSHEIRTPLNGVIGMLELLMHTELTERQLRFTTTAIQSGEMLLQLINDILDISKIESGELSLEAIPCDFHRLLKETGDVLAARAQKKGLELILDYAPDVPVHFLADQVRLQQIFTNLLNNAIKFTERGHVMLRVRRLPEGEGISIEVVDTGIGIAPDRLEDIFQKFMQENTATTRKFGGTGLGLAICRQLVMLMGGDISVTSIPGEGSCFRVELPLPELETPPRTVEKTHYDFTKARALVVDDNIVSQAVLSGYLQSWGIACDVCETGEEALAQMQDAARAGKPYVIAVIDFYLPGMDGIALGKAIKADRVLRECVLLMASASPTLLTSELKQMGFAGFLSKPVYALELFNLLVTAWNQHRAGVQKP